MTERLHSLTHSLKAVLTINELLTYIPLLKNTL